jgi:hypothetical protein
MNPRRNLRGRSSAFAFVVLVCPVTLAAFSGCSNRPVEILGPSQPSAEHRAASAPSGVLAPTPDIVRWEAPRIRVWTDGWRRFQKEGGVSLDPGRIYDFESAAGQPVTFYWSALPRTGQGQIIGYRWAVDMDDILDETPRSGPADVTHWSPWSIAETSASVGPFAAGPDPLGIHFFYVEARDDMGFVSLFTVRLQTSRVSATESESPALSQH